MGDSASFELGVTLVEPTPADIERFRRINAMSDTELRALVTADDHPLIVDAVETVIARRHAADPAKR